MFKVHVKSCPPTLTASAITIKVVSSLCKVAMRYAIKPLTCVVSVQISKTIRMLKNCQLQSVEQHRFSKKKHLVYMTKKTRTRISLACSWFSTVWRHESRKASERPLSTCDRDKNKFSKYLRNLLHAESERQSVLSPLWCLTWLRRQASGIRIQLFSFMHETYLFVLNRCCSQTF